MVKASLLSFFFLLSSCLMTGISNAVQSIGKTQAEALAKQQKGMAWFLFQRITRITFSYSYTIAKSIFLICYALTAFSFAFTFFTPENTLRVWLISLSLILGGFLVVDWIIRIFSLFRPHLFFKLVCQITSLLMLPFYPIALLFSKLLKTLPPPPSSYRIKDKILEILQDAEVSSFLDVNDQKLIMSVVSFKERIVREVMVPRIDMFTLNANTSIEKAAQNFLQEGYSRIPVWKENVDNIIGTLYYKDLLNIYFNPPEEQNALDAPIEKLLKPIVYSPETKKISQLLQEFRNKQIHLAIVVDEYGGTEGIVTIEDILEQLVGEIADEYDIDEEALYTILPSGGWIVDAKMTILDIENELGVQIPPNAEYDTIGGYIFHKTGTIPLKGWRLHQERFDLEILSSSERSIEKIRVTPH